jgi:hypothetical protein
MPPTDALNVHNDSLLVFIDDTGHETLAGDHAYYGLGGFAAVMQLYEQVIRPAWCEVRRSIRGSPEAPLHGATFGQAAKKRIMRFFELSLSSHISRDSK